MNSIEIAQLKGHITPFNLAIAHEVLGRETKGFSAEQLKGFGEGLKFAACIDAESSPSQRALLFAALIVAAYEKANGVGAAL